ncbi:hypothetical protein GQ43DRAFT_444505 [Delitschia confertaspora ATCC 74209]|uniref:Uncharacterized protein n=1 Tax=Delitschia confertaspora ATCC 74209 TaxID=1513339 RepID=A0A9P4JDA3_9PLEO|nr:hypothetical protein GQ43DRAFT_444505 [Delitschia confertaspora ATCC 74209]
MVFYLNPAFNLLAITTTKSTESTFTPTSTTIWCPTPFPFSRFLVPPFSMKAHSLLS